MPRLKGFKELTPIDVALEQFFSRLPLTRLDTVVVPIETALGRVTARKIVAERDSPPFDHSAVDGYALKASDTVGASLFQPKTLRLVRGNMVGEGEATEIWTGNPMPAGGDAVVMLEHTTKTKKEIKVLVSLPPAANVSKKGEDVKKRETGLDSGVRLKPQHLGLLASLGVKDVEVVKKPTVALLATGNELVALEEKQKPNQIVEVNSIILSGMCAELGAEGRRLGIAKDDEDELEEKVREGLAKANVVITTGGTSVGVRDLVPKVVTNMEANGVVAHGIAMRPGMPTALAVVQKKPVIMLSGNPVAAIIGFDVFARPLIQKLLGIKEGARMKVNAKLTRRVAGVLGRRVFVRVTVLERRGEFFAEPLRVKGSSIITSMTKANGYVTIPEAREGLRQHETVAVHLFDAIRSAENV